MTETKQTGISQKQDLLRTTGTWLANMNVYVFFSFIFIYHVVVFLQGLDFNDEGFHLAFYQQIFNDPESVQYAFWGWLSGLAGGTFMKLFPWTGIWGIRLLGAIISTSTIALAYVLLRKYIKVEYLRLSLIMLSIFINEDAKNLYYNNLSACLYFVLAYFLFKGLTNNKNLFIGLAGFTAGLNIFTRLPNILGIGMILVIIYYSYLRKDSVRRMLSQSVVFLFGTVTACLFVFLLMSALHHVPYFIGSVKMLFSSSNKASGDDGLNGAYGMGRLLTNNLIDYLKSLRFIFASGLIVYILLVLDRIFLRLGKWMHLIFRMFLLILIPFFLILIFKGWFTSYRLTEFFTGFSLLSALLLFDSKAANELKLLTFIGGYILLVHPFGSSEGILTVVVYSMWISFPIAVGYFRNISGLVLPSHLGSFVRNSMQMIQTTLYRKIFVGILFIVSIACLVNVWRYPYLCDRHRRQDMYYSVDNKFMKGIFTTRARVEAIDELLAASSKYIRPNDYVLAYDCMPLYHFMSETKSYVRNPCIWFYTTGLFKDEMSFARQHKKELPVIVRQLIATTGNGSSWPEVRPAENYLDFKRTQGKNKILNDFIKLNNYRLVWNNSEFEILVPPKS